MRPGGLVDLRIRLDAAKSLMLSLQRKPGEAGKKAQTPTQRQRPVVPS